MRILHVIRDISPSSGGPPVAARITAEAQAAVGCTVSVVTTLWGLDDAPDWKQVKLYLYPCHIKRWRWSWGLSREMPQIVKTADIVHIHTMWEYPTWAAAKTSARLGVPYVVDPCGMLEEWSLNQRYLRKRLYLLGPGKHILKKAAAIRFTSESERARSLDCIGNAPTFVVPVGLPASFYQRPPTVSAFRARLPALEGRRIVLFVGRLNYKKRPELVIAAFHQACRNDPNSCLVMVGPGTRSERNQLERIARGKGISERVFFLGLLQGEELREAYSAADLFVLPSLQENFGIVVTEAMSLGCPVIVSYEVGLAREIDETKAGIVCVAAVEPLAEAMAALLADVRERKAMGERGRRLVVEKFTAEKSAMDLLAVYCDILTSSRKHSAWRIIS